MEAASSTDEHKKPLFRDLRSSEELETTEIESLCISCEETGTTRLLLTKIPMFREVVIMSFSCPHCGYSNSEIQPGGPTQDYGVTYSLSLKTKEDLDRLVVKADTAFIRIPHLEFEIPPNTQKGKVSTIESIIKQSITEIREGQPTRKIMHPELAEKLELFISKLEQCLECTSPFIIELDDPAGNSFVENKLAPNVDPNLTAVEYTRSHEQDEQLGILAANQEEPEAVSPAPEEVLSFPSNCSQCNSPSETRMKTVAVPHFKEVIIMATSCEYCGFKSNEVKSGGGISPEGTRLTLNITHSSDMSRDILKSETSSFMIPELDLQLMAGTLGGQFTTLEGLLSQIREQLAKVNPLVVGDSDGGQSKMKSFLKKLDEIISGERLDVQIVLDDPAGNSYIQNTYAPDQDPELTVTHYQRTFEQNEELGLNDMNTDNYLDD